MGVYGREWYFGYTDTYYYGVHPMTPKQHPQHKYRSSIVMGAANMSCAEFEEQLPFIRTAWPSFLYDMRYRNCHAFTDFLCQMLGFQSGPKLGLYGRGDPTLARCTGDQHATHQTVTVASSANELAGNVSHVPTRCPSGCGMRRLLLSILSSQS